MLSMMILATLTLSPDDPPKPKPRPAAMVLDLRGKVEIRPTEGQPKAAEPGDLLYPGERLAVPAGGSATLSILGAGVRESIRPGSEATVGPKGCSPPGSIAARKEQPRAVASTMKNLRPAPGDGRKAGVGFRSGDGRKQAVSPISGATVRSDRTDLAWPASTEAKTYRVKLVSGAGRELWKVEAKEPRAIYPADKPALVRGYVYRWEVTDEQFRPVASGDFTVASESELAQLDELKPLAESPDRADRVAAGLSFRRLAAFAEAIATFERLTRESPDDPFARQILAELRKQAGLE